MNGSIARDRDNASHVNQGSRVDRAANTLDNLYNNITRYVNYFCVQNDNNVNELGST